MGKKENKYIKFAKRILKCLSNLRVRKYWNKYSKKTYTVWQHLVILALRQREGKSYRAIVDLLEICSKLTTFIELTIIPHYTTIQKAAKRMRCYALDKIIAGFILITRKRKLRIGVDSSGIKATHASEYYTNTIKRNKKQRRKIKRYIKPTICFELDKQLILADKIRRGPANDCPDFIPAIEKERRYVNKDIRSVDGDKAYDSEDNRSYVVNKLNAEDRIRIKRKDISIWRTKGEYRKKAKKNINKKKRNHRSKCETGYSVIKRIMGSTVRARNVSMQNKEVKFKEIAYNAHRLSNIFYLLKGFLQSLF